MAISGVQDICVFIKNQIMLGNYMEGERISERAICELFGVSRTIVREALFNLKKEGWIYAESKSGTYVKPLDDSIIHDNYEARLLLEPTILMMVFPLLSAADIAEMKTNCVRMENAVTNAEYSFAENDQHKILHRNIDNVYLRNLMESMMDTMTRIGSECGKTKQRQQECCKEWQSIIATLEANDPYAASQRFVNHIQNSYEAFLKYNPGPEEVADSISPKPE